MPSSAESPSDQSAYLYVFVRIQFTSTFAEWHSAATLHRRREQLRAYLKSTSSYIPGRLIPHMQQHAAVCRPASPLGTDKS